MTDLRTRCTLHVANLDSKVDTSVLHAAFIPFGDIIDILLPRDSEESFTHRGFGYVEFEEEGDAKAALDNMDLSELYGRVIRVSPAKPQKELHEGLGSDVPVWRQESWIQRYAVDQQEKEKPVEHNNQTQRPSNDPRDAMQVLDEVGPQE